MKTAQAVGDGSERARDRAKLPNELLGQLHRRVGELHRRIEEGAIDFQAAMDGLQGVIEGRFPFPVSCDWREENGIIYFSVTSDGKTGAQWIEYFEKKGDQISDSAKYLLLSPNFKPSTGVTTEIAVLKGLLFKDDDRFTSNIRAEAEYRGFDWPNVEVACLIRGKFTDRGLRAMDLWWILAMHEPIKDSDRIPHFLGVSRNDDGRWLDVSYASPAFKWSREYGFAFAVSSASS